MCLQHVPLTLWSYCAVRNSFCALCGYFLAKGASYIMVTVSGCSFQLPTLWSQCWDVLFYLDMMTVVILG